MNQKDTVLSVMKDANKPLRGGEIAELSGLDKKEVDKAMKELKAVFWEGTETWDQLLERRAETSGRLVLSEFTRKYIKAFRTK